MSHVFTQNNWGGIRSHYSHFGKKISAEKKNEWAIDPYAWSGLINFTPIEDWFWSDIRECDCVLYPQYPAGKFFLDFANPLAKVGIECDGAQYHKDKEKDAARDKTLQDMGWSIYRITGSDCQSESDFDTGRLSPAGVFLRRIALRHGLARDGFDQVLSNMLQRHDALEKGTFYGHE